MTALPSAMNMKLVVEETGKFVGPFFSIRQNNGLGNISTFPVLTTNENMTVYHALLLI
jgi:hypothetical protein